MNRELELLVLEGKVSCIEIPDTIKGLESAIKQGGDPWAMLLFKDQLRALRRQRDKHSKSFSA